MSSITKICSKILFFPVIFFGIFVMFDAAKGHGAGFAGGILIALSFVMMILSYGKDFFGKINWFYFLVSFALCFLAAVTVNMFAGASFVFNGQYQVFAGLLVVVIKFFQ